MHEQIAVLTDTNSGITPEQAARYGIYLVAMPVIIDDETYFERIHFSGGVLSAPARGRVCQYLSAGTGYADGLLGEVAGTL